MSDQISCRSLRGAFAPINNVATMLAWLTVYNATQKAHALHLDYSLSGLITRSNKYYQIDFLRPLLIKLESRTADRFLVYEVSWGLEEDSLPQW